MKVNSNIPTQEVEKIKVTILEDDEEYRKSLKSLLEREQNIWIYGEYSSPCDFLQSFQTAIKPDVCLVDIVLNECMTGLDCAKLVKDKYPGIKIIIMTSYPAANYLTDAKEIDADFIEKGTRGEILIDKIVTSCKSTTEQFISLNSRRGEFDPIELINQMNSVQEHIGLLSQYQKMVLKLKLEGKSVNESAVILKMNPRTVRTHLRRALNKLELPDLLQYIHIDDIDVH